MKQVVTVDRARLPDTPALVWTAAQAFAVVPVACT